VRGAVGLREAFEEEEEEEEEEVDSWWSFELTD
jgi:hypothetical protein